MQSSSERAAPLKRCGIIAFHANDHYQVGGYAYLYAPDMTLSTTQATIAGEDCVLHLDGPWWELGPGGGGIDCPGGFNYLPGPGLVPVRRRNGEGGRIQTPNARLRPGPGLPGPRTSASVGMIEPS
jgi:hypothetical protein